MKVEEGEGDQAGAENDDCRIFKPKGKEEGSNKDDVPTTEPVQADHDGEGDEHHHDNDPRRQVG